MEKPQKKMQLFLHQNNLSVQTNPKNHHHLVIITKRQLKAGAKRSVLFAQTTDTLKSTVGQRRGSCENYKPKPVQRQTLHDMYPSHYPRMDGHLFFQTTTLSLHVYWLFFQR